MYARNLKNALALLALAAPALHAQEPPAHVHAPVPLHAAAAQHATAVQQALMAVAQVKHLAHEVELHAAALPALASLSSLESLESLESLGSLAGLADLEHATLVDPEPYVVEAPEPWAAQDPADSLYRAARRALNEQDYARAAQLFRQIHSESRYRSSEYRALAYYYEAFARQRLGGRAELQRARSALEQMRTQHADAWREQRDAAALLARVNADLARLGEARAAQDLQARGAAAARGGCTDANAAVRIEALNALLQMDAESALPILEEVMKKRGDECSAELRRKAIFLVAQKRSERTTEILLEAARSDPDPEVQEQAVFWLSQVRDERAVGAIEQILASSKSPKLQERAVFALSQHRSDRAGELLRNYALRTDINDELRGQAIFWLSQRRGAENQHFLQEIYPRVNSREVKEKVIFAISQMRGEGSGDWLVARALDQNEDMALRKHALFWAGQQRAIPVTRLNELYDRTADRELKEQLVFVLSQRARDPQAVDVLMKIAKEEKDPEIRKQAIFWLGQSRDPRASKFLLDLIKN